MSLHWFSIETPKQHTNMEFSNILLPTVCEAIFKYLSCKDIFAFCEVIPDGKWVAAVVLKRKYETEYKPVKKYNYTGMECVICSIGVGGKRNFALYECGDLECEDCYEDDSILNRWLCGWCVGKGKKPPMILTYEVEDPYVVLTAGDRTLLMGNLSKRRKCN
ncbi:hypothetical protein Bhyg_09483 [Pseudolycoriella hygida]|uniref:Uncharacterized protein n=1 Tax=Pseudolycoriella hygida TaxID=35572 RepID=A0A9Q0N8F2_9DIPT|nr:hypothetical protein Bhyg_09483 [Pseudolycoriella hygida]